MRQGDASDSVGTAISTNNARENKQILRDKSLFNVHRVTWPKSPSKQPSLSQGVGRAPGDGTLLRDHHMLNG